MTDFFDEIFCNFAAPFIKSGVDMTVNNITKTTAHVQNFACKENWKSTAGIIALA